MTMNGKSLEALVKRVVEGDLHAFITLRSDDHPGTEELIESNVTFDLKPAGVKAVLFALRNKEFSQDLVQRWAHFMRFGVYGGNGPPRRALSINYELDRDGPMTHAVYFLCDLGDFDDREPSDEVLDELIRSLDELQPERQPSGSLPA